MRVCHDLNGRAAALGALQQLIDMGDTPPSALEHETERLAVLARRVAMLPADPTQERSALSLGRLVERALEVLGMVHDADVRGGVVRIDEETPPVLVQEGACMRGLLLYVDWALRTVASSPAVFEVTGTPDAVVLRCRVGVEAVDAEPLDRLCQLFALDGGEAGMEHDGYASLRLPSLASARARGY